MIIIIIIILFLYIAENSEYKHRVHSIKELVKQLPRPNHDTMQLLFKHLRKYGTRDTTTFKSIALHLFASLCFPGNGPNSF